MTIVSSLISAGVSGSDHLLLSYLYCQFNVHSGLFDLASEMAVVSCNTVKVVAVAHEPHFENCCFIYCHHYINSKKKNSEHHSFCILSFTKDFCGQSVSGHYRSLQCSVNYKLMEPGLGVQCVPDVCLCW